MVLFFWRLTDDKNDFTPTDHTFDLNVDLKEVYDVYHPLGKLEVVFVALGNNKRIFNNVFSYLPWLAIPHNDEKGRHLFEELFAIPISDHARTVLFSRTGTILLEDCGPDFRVYGPDAFPFSKKKVRELCHASDALWDKLVVKKQRLPLNVLLGDYVISSEGNQASYFICICANRKRY